MRQRSAAAETYVMGFSLRRRLSSRKLAPGRYLTDGRRLLRILSKFDDSRSVMVLVEDCLTLDAHAYALLELRAMGFRLAPLA